MLISLRKEYDMDFLALEMFGKRALEKHTFIKRLCKRLYQLGMYAASIDKIKSEGTLIKVSPDDEYEYFFGYYDKSPWDISDRYMICLRVKQAYKSVAPEEPAEILLLDTANNNAPLKIASTRAWNVQQGCMAQWLGPDFSKRIIYNDCRDGHYCSIIYNITEMAEEKVLPCAIYDVAKDGSFALGLDFSRLHRMRPGYGYSNLPDKTKGELCPEKTCIYKINIRTGQVVDLLKYTDFNAFEHTPEMDDAEHKVNHLMINPSGNRFMVLHRWFANGRKHTRLVTANCDGTDLFNLSDDVFVSHCYWKNDYEILSFLRKKETGDHYYLMKDKTHEYCMYWPELNTDGHCSYSPDGSMVIADSYPNRKRIASVYLCQEQPEIVVHLARVFAPFRYDNDVRCDLHPRWNRLGDKICIDSVHNGKRGLYVIPVNKSILTSTCTTNEKKISGKYKIVYFITNCKKTGPMNQTLNIIHNMDRTMFDPILVTLFKEDAGNSILAEYKKVCSACYCLNMNKYNSILLGKQKLSNLLKEIKPDLIHSVGMPPYTISLAYKDAIHFVTLRNYCYDDYPHKYGKILGRVLAFKDMNLIKKQIKRGETFVTCSESLSKIYKEKHGLNVEYIRNGVDISKYEYHGHDNKLLLREKLKLPQNKIIAIYTGQVNDRKNQRFAIEGILKSKQSEDVVLLLLGDGPNLQSLKEKYKEYDQIIFTGNVPNVNEYLQASDYYISTSKSEGMPNGVLEAMAVGLPLLLSDIPQHKEVFEVDSEIGMIYRLGDMDSLVNAINNMSKSDLLSKGERSYKVVSENLTARLMSEKYQVLYRQMIEKRSLIITP